MATLKTKRLRWDGEPLGVYRKHSVSTMNDIAFAVLSNIQARYHSYTVPNLRLRYEDTNDKCKTQDGDEELHSVGTNEGDSEAVSMDTLSQGTGTITGDEPLACVSDGLDKTVLKDKEGGNYTPHPIPLIEVRYE